MEAGTQTTLTLGWPRQFKNFSFQDVETENRDLCLERLLALQHPGASGKQAKERERNGVKLVERKGLKR